MLKIVSTKLKTKYLIELIDNKKVIKRTSATGLDNRDSIIQDWCGIYGTLEVVHTINKVKTPIIDEVVDIIPNIPYVDELQLEKYFDVNSKFIFDRIVEAVNNGIITKRKKIKLFELEDTGIYITSSKRSWAEGIRTAKQYYLEFQEYSMVTECDRLLSILV